MNFSVTSVILLVSCINGILFFILALTKGSKDRHNYFIALLLLLCSLMLFDEFTRWTKDFFSFFPQFTIIFTFAWFLVIPALFLLVRFQVNKTLLHWTDVLHLIPLLIQLGIGTDYFASAEVKKNVLERLYVGPEPHEAKIIFASQIIVYLMLIYFLLYRKYKLEGFKLFKKMSPWLKTIYILLLVYLLSIVVIIYFVEARGIHLRWLDIGKTFSFLFIIYGWLIYMLNKPSALKYPIKSVRVWMDRFNFDDLSPELKRIVEEINQKELHLKKDVQLYDLASQLNISGRQLTNRVNSELNISVPQLINILRIKAMEKRFMHKDFSAYSLLGLAKSVGFKSKTSFYRSFKQLTGETPSEYFKKLSMQ